MCVCENLQQGYECSDGTRISVLSAASFVCYVRLTTYVIYVYTLCICGT